MSSFFSTGSPKLGRKASSGFDVLADNEDYELPTTNETAAPKLAQSFSSKPTPSPLQSTKLANLQAKMQDKKPKVSISEESKDESLKMNEILARLRINESKKPTAKSNPPVEPEKEPKRASKLPTNLNGQSQALSKRCIDLINESDFDGPKYEERSSIGGLYKPATESFTRTSSKDCNEAGTPQLEDASEILRVKQELAAAKSTISRQEQELAETRKLRHTMDQAMGPPSEADFGISTHITEQTISHLQSAFNASVRPFTSRTDSWAPQEDSCSGNPDGLSAGSYKRGHGAWNNSTHPMFPSGFSTAAQKPLFNNPRGGLGPEWDTGYSNQGFDGPNSLVNRRMAPTSATPSYGFDGRYGHGHVPVPGQSIDLRRTMRQFNRAGPKFGNLPTPYGSYPTPIPNLRPASTAPTRIPAPMSYQTRPIGSPLSPPISDFAPGSLPTLGSPWPSINASGSQTYVAPLEPINYRRLLDKSASCDWKYIVDKIVFSNDQQASIFLQQKLKISTAEQKFEIVEAIVNQACPLMANRFGNFLVQRCFEHGTPAQVVAIAHATRGNVIFLSMDQFGCHVIQKAFDCVPEQQKADMVRELLQCRIPDTVVNRHACHVWQKMFELRWSGEPPPIMLKVNEALRGMWHEVALGETGSLVVQNIFENCVEEEKRPAIEEVIANIDLVAHGQFGNWCIQHICENGSPPDKRRVINHILCNAYSYSLDQFASKVIEKCLKICGVEFLEHYLAIITTARQDRPRIPLIDISSNQHGNYLIQWILMNTHHHQRERVAVHIRKHMVSLRGSKYGCPVALLCCDPALLTRPGHGVVANPFGAPGQPRGWGRFRQ